MDNLTVFSNELKKIQDGRLRELVVSYLDEKVPSYFWTAPSSSSGKYHSSFDAGESGLVRHTKMCVAVAEELLKLAGFIELNPDLVFSAMLMHDTLKNGWSGAHYRADHPKLAADNWSKFLKEKNVVDKEYSDIAIGIAWHSGQWTGPATKNAYPYPTTRALIGLTKCTHLSDYIASRQFMSLEFQQGLY